MTHVARPVWAFAAVQNLGLAGVREFSKLEKKLSKLEVDHFQAGS
jgi:hypothetical protein